MIRIHCLTCVLCFINLLNRYDLDGGETFRGRTFIINDPKAHIYIMFGENESIFWVKFTEDEYKYEKTLSKLVRLGKFCLTH